MVEIKNLAIKIRKAFEEIERKKYYRPDLTGYCKRASIQFFLEARKQGFDVSIAASYVHVYNIYDRYIVDITASQFGVQDRVLITQISKRSQNRYWKPRPGGENIKSLEELNNIGWIIYQSEIDEDYKFVKKYLGEDK